MEKVTKIYPEIMDEKWFARRIKASYNRIRNEALGGTAHGIVFLPLSVLN